MSTGEDLSLWVVTAVDIDYAPPIVYQGIGTDVQALYDAAVTAALAPSHRRADTDEKRAEVEERERKLSNYRFVIDGGGYIEEEAHEVTFYLQPFKIERSATYLSKYFKKLKSPDVTRIDIGLPVAAAASESAEKKRKAK